MVLSSVYVIDAICFDECFLFHVIAGRRYFFWEFVVTIRFFQPPYSCFLWNKCFERSSYLSNNSIALILMLMLISKKSYPIIYLHILEKLSYVAGFFYDNAFYTLYLFTCSTIFFIKLFFFFWKTQNISESMFLHNTAELS